MIRFALFTTSMMAVLIAIVYTGGQYHWVEKTPSFALEIVLFLGLSTLVIYYFLIRHAQSPSFTQAYLVSMVLKMLGYATFMLVIMFSDKPGAVANAVLFLVAYLLFTGLEVGFLFNRINR